MMQIAIVGPIGSGKTTLANILVNKFGFLHFKLSKGIVDEGLKRGIDIKNRDALQNLGDELRAKYGEGILAKQVLQTIKLEHPNYKNLKLVFESIRNPYELNELRRIFPNLKIVAVDASIKLRYRRVVLREGQYNEQTENFDKFKTINQRDLGKENKENEQNVLRCIGMADIKIRNNGNLNELKQSILSIIE